MTNAIHCIYEISEPNINTITINANINVKINHVHIAHVFKDKYLDNNIIGFKYKDKEFGNTCHKKRKNKTVKSNAPIKSFSNQATFVYKYGIQYLKIKIFKSGKMSIPGWKTTVLTDIPTIIQNIINKLKELQMDNKEMVLYENKEFELTDIKINMIKGNYFHKYISELHPVQLKDFINEKYSEHFDSVIYNQGRYAGIILKHSKKYNYTISIFSTGRIMFVMQEEKALQDIIEIMTEIVREFTNDIIDKNKFVYCRIMNRSSANENQINVYVYNKMVNKDKIKNISIDKSFHIDLLKLVEYYQDAEIELIRLKNGVLNSIVIDKQLIIFTKGNVIIDSDNYILIQKIYDKLYIIIDRYKDNIISLMPKRRRTKKIEMENKEIDMDLIHLYINDMQRLSKELNININVR